MKRDEDLIRDLLFRYEGQDDWQHMMPGVYCSPDDDEDKEHYHILLMADVGFVTSAGDGLFRLTAQGHDFIDAVRSDTVWHKTKEAAGKLGGVTLEILKDIAIGYIKNEAKKAGIPL